MKRQLVAAAATVAMLVTPATAALATEHEAPEDETTVLESFAETLGGLVDDLLEGRAATAEDEVDDETVEAFEALLENLESVLSDVFATMYFEVVETEALEEAAEGANGEAVSTLAQCAPRGTFKDLIEGVGNHGEHVTAASQGETVGLFVPTLEVDAETGEVSLAEPVEGEDPELSEFDLTTAEGATDLCGALDVVYQARLLELEVAWEDVDTAKDARVLAREQCQIERLRVKNGLSDSDANEYCAELKDRVRAEQLEDKDAAKLARDEAKADRDAEREQRKADRADAKADRGNGNDND